MIWSRALIVAPDGDNYDGGWRPDLCDEINFKPATEGKNG